MCNITYCEKAAVWQSVSSVQATLSQDPQTYTAHSCRTLASQSSRRGDRLDWLTAEEENDNRWMRVVLVFEVDFPHSYAAWSEHAQYAEREWASLTYITMYFCDWQAAEQLVDIRITCWELNANTEHVFRWTVDIKASAVECCWRSSAILIKK